jgi:hypothetical protein
MIADDQGLNASRHRERGSWAFSAIACALALATRTGRLSDSLWYDELWSTHVKLGTLWTFAVSTLGDLHPPGYALLMFVWTHILGDHEWVVRAVPLAAGIATVLFVYRLGRIVFDEWTGRIAAIVLAVAPVHVWYSQEARSYALNTFVLLLAGFSLITLRRGPASRAWIVVLAVALVTLPLLHYYNIAAVALLGWEARFLPRPRKGFLVATAVVSVLAILVYAGVKQQLGMLPASALYLRAFTPSEFWQLLFTWFLTGDGLRWFFREDGIGWMASMTVQLSACVLLAGGLARSVAGDRDVRVVAFLFAAYPAILLCLWIAGFSNSYVERSALPALPFFVLLLVAGARAPRFGPRAGIATGLIALQLTGLYAMWAHPADWTVYKPREDWRNLASWIRDRQSKDGPQALLLANEPALSLIYYDAAFAERIDFAAKLQERSSRIEDQLERLGLSATPALNWVRRGAEAAEARAQTARVLVVDSPLLPSARDSVLTGRVVTSVVVVDVGTGTASRTMTELLQSPLFRETGHQTFRRLDARIFEPTVPGKSD